MNPPARHQPARHQPAWQPYADTIIARLIAHDVEEKEAREDDDDQAHTKDSARDPIRDPGGQVPRRARSPFLAAFERAQAGEPPGEAAAPPQPVRIPPRRLSLALRLAATIGNEAVLARALDARGIVVLDRLLPEEMPEMQWLLQNGIAMTGRRFCSRLHHCHDAGAGLLLAPKLREGEASQYVTEAFHRDVANALALDAPTVILLTAGVTLPDAILPGAQIHRLCPLNRAVMLRHLTQSHGITGDAMHKAACAALPDDRALAALGFTALLLALREPDAVAVAGRLAALTALPARSGPRLEEMTGDAPALITARRMVADLALWQRGEIAWDDLSRSLLLYGPPGTGKTWLARAMGASAGVAFVAATFAEWQSAGHLGDMLREMRKSFSEARRLAPTILMIDEIDAVGSRGGDDNHGRSYRAQVINGFLAELDRLAREPGVIVVGACNHPDRIDPAILRPGRFDIRLPVPLPDTETLRGILDRHLRGAFAPAAVHALAADCVGRSAAEIDAAIRAARSEARQAGASLDPDRLRHHLGLWPDPHRDARDRRVAIHECGHAIVCTALGTGTVSRILITPAGGETHRKRATNEARLSDAEDDLACLLAGRAAEHLMTGDISGGAGGPHGSDLAEATRLALAIDTTLGLGLNGPLWQGATDHALLARPAIAASVRRRLEKAEGKARDILHTNRDLLARMAADLATARELQGDRLTAWTNEVRRPAEAGPPPTAAVHSRLAP